eukprot:gene988-1243_t
MASRLSSEGFTLTLWNRTPEVADDLAAMICAQAGGAQAGGAQAVGDLSEAFVAAPVVHSMLTDDSTVLSVFSDELLATVPADRVHVNHATISPAAAHEL